MNKLMDLHIALRLYQANFMNLHWNAKGEDFNDSHKSISSDYYDLCYKYIDSTAEMLARFGINAPNYLEVAKSLDESDHKFAIVDSSRLYTRLEIIELASIMLTEICSLIEGALSEEIIQDPSNVGIKSDLEAMHSEFDLQARYINKRRLA